MRLIITLEKAVLASAEMSLCWMCPRYAFCLHRFSETLLWNRYANNANDDDDDDTLFVLNYIENILALD